MKYLITNVEGIRNERGQVAVTFIGRDRSVWVAQTARISPPNAKIGQTFEIDPLSYLEDGDIKRSIMVVTGMVEPEHIGWLPPEALDQVWDHFSLEDEICSAT